MRRLLVSLVAAMAIGFCNSAMSQALWGGSSYGMTVEQVRKAIPEVQAQQKGGTLGSGAVEKLRRNDVMIVGKEFKASFFFKNDRLEQVTLAPMSPLTSAQAAVTFDSLIDALRTKYGPEISKKEQGGAMKIRDYTWLSERTNVSAVLLIIGDSSPVLNIAYQVRLAKEAENL